MPLSSKVHVSRLDKAAVAPRPTPSIEYLSRMYTEDAKLLEAYLMKLFSWLSISLDAFFPFTPGTYGAGRAPGNQTRHAKAAAVTCGTCPSAPDLMLPQNP